MTISKRLCIVLPLLLLCVAGPSFAEGAAERLYLAAGNGNGRAVEVGLMKPFDVLLIAERDAEHPQVSTVVFTLDVPDGLVLVGEEILTESLVALGTPRTGINLSFLCVEAPSIEVMRFRFLATRPMDAVQVSLLPDTRTNFLGIVACVEEKYDKWDTEPSSVQITAR
jgi:hypothetical protein